MPYAFRRKQHVKRYGVEEAPAFNVNEVVIVNGSRFSHGLDLGTYYPATIIEVIPVSGSEPRYSIQYHIDDSVDEVNAQTLRINDPSVVPSMILIAAPVTHGLHHSERCYELIVS